MQCYEPFPNHVHPMHVGATVTASIQTASATGLSPPGARMMAPGCLPRCVAYMCSWRHTCMCSWHLGACQGVSLTFVYPGLLQGWLLKHQGYTLATTCQCAASRQQRMACTQSCSNGSLRVLTVSTEVLCAWNEWLGSSSRTVLTLPLSQTNFTSLATPNQVGSGKTALVTLLHEGGHAAHFSNILQVCAFLVCVGFGVFGGGR